MIDEIDRQILNILQQNARTPNAEIARQVGMAPSAVLERIRKLETRGVIRGYEARIDPEALGLSLLSFVFVRADDASGERTGEALAQIPEVQEVHHIAGEDCYLAKVRVRDAKSLGRLLRERFAGSGTVRSTRTTVVLETLRESAQLPVGVAAVADPVKSIEPVEQEEEVLL
ncbi:MAG TPA: Lrp/AsnC family transcriptional regulator [Thermoanaerobaculia bacterium]|nr:Lrp/AsnC family transcriptional regulator [Thermoanaerobaculia bacterium]